MYSLWGFSWKQRAHGFFSGGHPQRFEVTLISLTFCLMYFSFPAYMTGQIVWPSKDLTRHCLLSSRYFKPCFPSCHLFFTKKYKYFFLSCEIEVTVLVTSGSTIVIPYFVRRQNNIYLCSTFQVCLKPTSSW